MLFDTLPGMAEGRIGVSRSRAASRALSHEAGFAEGVLALLSFGSKPKIEV